MIDLIKYCTISGSSVCDLSYGMDERHPYCMMLKYSLREAILQIYATGVSDFLCNAEYGLPLWAAEIISSMVKDDVIDARLNLVVPYENQASQWSDEVRERYYNVHETADAVFLLHKQYTEDCYKEADKFMINHSAVLITDNGNNFITEYAQYKKKYMKFVNISANS